MPEQKEQEKCELCGDTITEKCQTIEIDDLASEFFMLDAGTIVHQECFDDSKTPGYMRELREIEGYDNIWEDW